MTLICSIYVESCLFFMRQQQKTGVVFVSVAFGVACVLVFKTRFQEI
jgi:hypothetical protein